MANDKTYYVKLKPSAGGKMLKVSAVETYVREAQTIPGEVYRDLFPFTPGSFTQYSTTLPVGIQVMGSDGAAVTRTDTGGGIYVWNGTIKTIAPDNVQHVAPRQSTYNRYAHIFKNSDNMVIGFFWDDFVVGVTDDQNQF